MMEGFFLNIKILLVFSMLSQFVTVKGTGILDIIKLTAVNFTKIDAGTVYSTYVRN